MNRIITISLLVLASVLSPVCAEVPTLKFPEEFSWKGIFDAGFRPKHISGLERVKAECRDQEFILKFKGQPALFLERGRLSIRLRSDNNIEHIEHLGRIPITLQEAEKQLNLFHTIFGEVLIRKGTLPHIADQKMGTVNTYSGSPAVATKNGYSISYRFTSSFQKEKPVLPVFTIILERKKDELRPPVRRHIVEPPEGYEDYDMTPISRVAEFYKKAQVDKSKNVGSEQITRPLPSDEQNRNEKPQDIKTEQTKSRLVWILAGIVLLTVVIIKVRGKSTS